MRAALNREEFRDGNAYTAGCGNSASVTGKPPSTARIRQRDIEGRLRRSEGPVSRDAARAIGVSKSAARVKYHDV